MNYTYEEYKEACQTTDNRLAYAEICYRKFAVAQAEAEAAKQAEDQIFERWNRTRI